MRGFASPSDTEFGRQDEQDEWAKGCNLQEFKPKPCFTFNIVIHVAWCSKGGGGGTWTLRRLLCHNRIWPEQEIYCVR